ncbi:MAG: Hpt domain-containing protein, partial [Gammaproteobacteria bacterium]|nr:Hpt domain-containing protein [Gammaproteobacteria bacterium]
MTDSAKNPMLDLFRIEVETHCTTIKDGLVNASDRNGDQEAIKPLVKAAHSIMGAARMVKLNPAIDMAKTIEDILTTAQQGKITFDSATTEAISSGTDHLYSMTRASDAELNNWENDHNKEIEKINSVISTALSNKKEETPVPKEPTENKSGAPETKGIPEVQPTTSVDESMLDLFKVEVETNSETLNTALLELEDNPADAEKLESLMRAAHSIKGAARMVGVNAAVALAHIMEDGFTAAQNGSIILEPAHIDILLAGVDMLNQISLLNAEEHLVWPDQNRVELEELLVSIRQVVDGEIITTQSRSLSNSETEKVKIWKEAAIAPNNTDKPVASNNLTNSTVRVSAERINRLIGLSGEFMVASGWINTYSNTILSIKKQQTEIFATIEKLRINMEASNDTDDASRALITEALHKSDTCGQSITNSLSELDDFDRRTEVLADRLNYEVISSRMRPFKEGIQGFQRMIRDVSRSLNKKIDFKITGEDTQVDRDILQKIEAPLNHILRNAVDHGIELPEERINAGKPENGTIHLEAFHNAGMLSIVVSDDGRGVDQDKLRKKIVDKGMVTEEMARNLSESELLDFLFLPG